MRGLIVLLAGFLSATGLAVETEVPFTTAQEVLNAWKSNQLTGICPYNRVSDEDMSRFKQAIAATCFTLSEYGRGPTYCTMILCPQARPVPYMISTDDAFNKAYIASESGGRQCFENASPE